MDADAPRGEPRRSLWYAVLVGIGVMAAIDEIVFHQVLQWHHFFDLSTPAIGILADGLLHAAELLVIVAGFFLLVDLAQRRQLMARWAWAGLFIGLGAFQLGDGIINHKVLRIHQIRYGVDLLIYDLTWNLVGVILLAIGLWLYFRARTRQHHEAQPA